MSSISSIKKSSLRRKDTMWIYKNPQGLQILDNELNERRKKRFARNRASPPFNTPMYFKEEQQLSTTSTLDTTVIPIARKAVEEKKIVIQDKKEFIPVARKLVEKENKILIVVAKKMEEEKTIPIANKKIEDEKISVAAEKITEEKEEFKPTITRKVVVVEEKKIPTITRKAVEEEKKKEFIPIAKKDIPQRPSISSSSKQLVEEKKKQFINNKQEEKQPIRVSSPPSPLVTKTESSKSRFVLEAKQMLFLVQQLEQPKPIAVKKSLLNAPIKKNGLVFSFVSAFETPPTPSITTSTTKLKVNKLTAAAAASPSGPPPKPPRHLVMPTSSVSTPLSPPIVTEVKKMILPTTSSSSSILPTTTAVAAANNDSYFSSVIDRRFNASPPRQQFSPHQPVAVTEEEEEEEEESTIQVYLPQLSPEISFCEDTTLDIPSDNESEQERPCIKKRVSFSEQLSTFIPDNDEDNNSITTEEEEQQRAYIPMTKFVRTLSHELLDASTILVKEKKVNSMPRDKFVPAPIGVAQTTKWPTSNNGTTPQKLSNKLLDMFQKKPKSMTESCLITVQPATRELTHLTKSRPRKPASLKKPTTTLTYPAAIAQPDWRTRAITTNKKSAVFV